jgi:hypothetical protein
MKEIAYDRLSDDWLTNGHIDMEYKKYVLLAYLQKVEARFQDKILYPPFSDIIFHYKNLLNFQEKNRTFIRNFPKIVKGLDMKNISLQYEEIFEDEKFMEEINEIVDFAIPQLSRKMEIGKSIYEEIENNVKIEPIGLCPINQNEGYLLFNLPGYSDVHIFEYRVTIFESADEKFKGIHTRFIEKISQSISNSFESIKMQMIRKYKALPNPATFLVDCQLITPFEETLLPISKRMLIQKLSA